MSDEANPGESPAGKVKKEVGMRLRYSPQVSPFLFTMIYNRLINYNNSQSWPSSTALFLSTNWPIMTSFYRNANSYLIVANYFAPFIFHNNVIVLLLLTSSHSWCFITLRSVDTELHNQIIINTRLNTPLAVVLKRLTNLLGCSTSQVT